MTRGCAAIVRLLGVALAVLPLSSCESDREPARAPEPSRTVASATPEPASAEADGGVAAGIVRAYYQAIQERRYRDAYALWASGGVASMKTFEEFRAGFATTDSVAVSLGTPGPIEGAAGSRYVEVPAEITARHSDGTTQHFSGTYTLRRSVVDGATADQRAWRIYSARIHPVKSSGRSQ